MLALPATDFGADCLLQRLLHTQLSENYLSNQCVQHMYRNVLQIILYKMCSYVICSSSMYAECQGSTKTLFMDT